MDKDERGKVQAMLKEWKVKERRWRKVHQVPDSVAGSYRTFPMFGWVMDEEREPFDFTHCTIVSQGGWLIGKKWMTTDELWAARDRWAAASYAAAMPQALTEGGAYQCGGCRFFAALDADWGLCCNPASQMDGKVTFEHGGCVQHSYVQTELAKEIKRFEQP